MKWHNYPPSFRVYESVFKDRIVERVRETRQRTKGTQELVELLVDLMSPMGEQIMQNTASLMLSEAAWLSEKRPYYNVWPSVIEPFTSLDLNRIKVSDLSLPLERLVVRFPVGHELCGARSIFVMQGRNGLVPQGSKDKNYRAFLIGIDSGAVNDLGVSLPTVNVVTVNEDQTIAERLKIGRDLPYSEDTMNNDMVDQCWKLVIAISLLGNNPDLIERTPLDSDRIKWEETHDIALIEKAECKGKLEWDIGKHIEVAPGYRNPHFAIRWMGRGVAEKKATLRPIKGCLVKRRVIEDVPTGWLDEDEPESKEE